MDIGQNFIVTDFSSEREKKITHYIINHPNCSANKVIVYCSQTGGPVKRTVEGILAKLEEDGIVTEKPNPNDKRAFCLTVESENLIEILPRDLENIFSKVLAFTKLITTIVENRNLVGDKPLPNHISERVTYEAKSSLPFLPYYLIEIITSFYMFYFSFVLPQKIENQKLITKLYSWYFENL
ncbi:MAG: helix-turn-helix domain-containing protein [Candidatus Nitrosocosmicus sp.]|nr:helix-turn-helix domain-containing protein [Candidatus Nitrosocosmicus sp.]